MLLKPIVLSMGFFIGGFFEWRYKREPTTCEWLLISFLERFCRLRGLKIGISQVYILKN